MPKSPEVFLLHMVDEVRYLRSLNHIRDGSSLNSEPTVSRAVIRSLEVIGEAASNIDEEYRSQHPEVPWRRIVALRNRLIHGYMGINYNIVVNVLHNEIPELERLLVPLVPSHPASQ